MKASHLPIAWLRVVLGGGSLLLTGCAVMGLPAGYVAVPTARGMAFHAVAPTGNTLQVRIHENPEGADLAFWQQAIERELVTGRGYRLLDSQAVQTTSGWTGKELLLETDRQLGEFQYLLSIYVLDGGLWRGARVVVAEAGGEKAALQADLSALRQALRTLR
jgi:hypothetical protein